MIFIRDFSHEIRSQADSTLHAVEYHRLEAGESKKEVEIVYRKQD